MGGVVSLGYDVVDRKLVPNEAEAETVRTLFRLYLEHGTVRSVKEEADRLGLRTKARKPNNGQRLGGEPFTRGHIYKLLTNPIYVGDMVHKGERFKGEHQAIVDPEIWDAAQQQLGDNAVVRRSTCNVKTQSLLTGLLVDGDGERLVPTYARKGERQYRYYISKPLKERASDTGRGWRLPAQPVEDNVVGAICRLLQDKPRMSEALNLSGSAAGRLKATLSKSRRLGERLRNAGPDQQRAFLREVVNRVEIGHDMIRIHLKASALRAMVHADKLEDEQGLNGGPWPDHITIDLPVTFKRRGAEMKLVLADNRGPLPAPDPNLINLVVQAWTWFDQLKAGEVRSARDLVTRHGLDPGDVSRILPFAFLAPDIVEAILKGRQPIGLTASHLKRLRALPPSWAEQHRLLGFD